MPIIDQDKFEETRQIVSVVTGYMVLPLYFFFWAGDIQYQPELKWPLLLIRTSVIPVVIVVHILIGRASTYLQAQQISLFYTICMGLVITAIILYIGETSSPYYRGLCLVAIGALSFVPWNARYFSYAVAGLFLPYYLVEWHLYQPGESFTPIIMNAQDITSVVLITAVIRLFREKLRQRERDARLELNMEIEQRKRAQAELVEARDMAVNATQAKSNFLANMSHELRTPMNAILGYTDLLREELEERNIAELVTDTDKIRDSGTHLLDLINSILDLSKIEAGKMEILIESVNIRELMKQVAITLEPIAEKRHNRLSIHFDDAPESIETDLVKLRQILLNLGGNAIKFTAAGEVTFRLMQTVYDNLPCLKISVSDTGVGMSEEQLSTIFEPFSQADESTTRNYGGTGLGLTITRHFTEMLKGTMTVASSPGKGSTFSILLPM